MNTKRILRSLAASAGILLLLLTSMTTGVSAKSADALSGGTVLPATAMPQGFSLTEAAFATAYFNADPNKSLDALPAGFPFEVLYIRPDGNTTFTVKPGTMFYVPLIWSDNLDAAFWDFPDVTDPAAVSAYYFDPQQLGAEFMRITVDGQVYDLGPAYAVGTVTSGLPDGGTDYTVVAAFLTPLSKGTHTVTFSFLLSGAFLGGTYPFDFTYTVVVN